MRLARVALVSPYALSVFGGVQEQVLSMSRVLSARGVEVLVVAPDVTDVSVYDTPARVVRFGRLVSIPANGSRAPLTLSLRASARARDAVVAFVPDVVHLHEPFAPVLGYSLLRSHGVASVATFHRAGGGPAYNLTRPLLRRLARGIDAAAAVSESAARTIDAGAAVATQQLFNGFETERFREVVRELPSVITILYVGRLESRKGVATLLEAARLHATLPGPRWRFVIAGDGSASEQLRDTARSLHDVEFVGALSDSEKRRLMRHCHVQVAPSTHGESFGLVLLEAMAAETPVVASDIEGYRQAAAGHAEMFEPGDSVALVGAITRALTRTDEQVAAARQHAERWSMASLVDRYEEIYDTAHVHFTSAQ